MWAPVQTCSSFPGGGGGIRSRTGSPNGNGNGSPQGVPDVGSPSTRCKHAMATGPDGHVYLMGGRSGNLPLKDVWRFDPEQNVWEEVKCKGHHPPWLQEHTMVSWNNKLYVFGGEVGFSANCETPLWILDLDSLTWRKQTNRNQCLPPGSTRTFPVGRRGHSAVVYGDGMHIYGGYQDLRGSSAELWTFDLVDESWHLITCSGRSSAQPSGRHSHSAVVDGDCMWILGGQTDLQEKNDFWKWNFRSREWHKMKTNKGPGELHSHSAVTFRRCMFIFGGERKGSLLHDLWKFSFESETWEKISTEGMIPNPRSRHTAVGNPLLFLEMWNASDTKSGDTTPMQESRWTGSHHLNSIHENHDPHLQQKNHHNNKNRTVMVPPKSISMCFGISHGAHSPLNETVTPYTKKGVKYLKGIRVHPMSLNLCSRGVPSTVSDGEDPEDDSSPNDARITASNRKKGDPPIRRTLREKISHSRIVRSISGTSYSHSTHEDHPEPKGSSSCSTSSASSTVSASAGSDSSVSSTKSSSSASTTSVDPHTPSPQLILQQQQGAKDHPNPIPKSASSDAVLGSESQNATPTRVPAPEVSYQCSNQVTRRMRPKSEFVESTKSRNHHPMNSEDTLCEEGDFVPVSHKRHTVHESMSYYSLCFPSPHLKPHNSLKTYYPLGLPLHPELPSPSSNQDVLTVKPIPRPRMSHQKNMQPETNGNQVVPDNHPHSSPDHLPSPCSSLAPSIGPLERISSRTIYASIMPPRMSSPQFLTRRTSMPKVQTPQPKEVMSPSSDESLPPSPQKDETDPTLDFSLYEFEEDDVIHFRRSTLNNRSVNFKLVNQQNRRETALVDFDPLSPGVKSDVAQHQSVISPGGPDTSSTTTSSASMFGVTDMIRSHYSSGYQSLTDDTVGAYDNHGSALNQMNLNQTSGVDASKNGVVMRRNRVNRCPPTELIELRSSFPNPRLPLMAMGPSHNINRHSMIETTSMSSSGSRLTRARSLDRKVGRTSVTPGNETKPWVPQVDSIREVVVPSSPNRMRRSWSSYSPTASHPKSKCILPKSHSNNHDARNHHHPSYHNHNHNQNESNNLNHHHHHNQHHNNNNNNKDDSCWQLCMYVFGGKEAGVSAVDRQPMSVWKLYI